MARTLNSNRKEIKKDAIKNLADIKSTIKKLCKNLTDYGLSLYEDLVLVLWKDELDKQEKAIEEYLETLDWTRTKRWNTRMSDLDATKKPWGYNGGCFRRVDRDK